MMNRPRNRQPRPPRDQGSGGRGGRGNGHQQNRPRAEYKQVPSVQQVQPGKSVSTVLKQDQSTGRQVQGVVQELLTRGDHPRGIKVRLTDGRVGRVQRMSDGSSSDSGHINVGPSISAPVRPVRGVRLDEHPEGLPPRTLADYLPDSGSEHKTFLTRTPTLTSTVVAKCPVCGIFEGDEAAVSRHVDEHFN